MCFRSEASYIANMFCTKFKKSIKAMRSNVGGEEVGIYYTTPGKSPNRTSPVLGLHMDGFSVNQDLLRIVHSKWP